MRKAVRTFYLSYISGVVSGELYVGCGEENERMHKGCVFKSYVEAW